ncbi:MAG: transposase [Bernardetiaceae bacterium]|nr:transposase [Bernardetiaceae bacterium]
MCQKAEEEEPPPPEKGARGKPKNSKGRYLLNRLIKHQAGVLAFAVVEFVPFTNNLAEQEVRCVKIKQKVAMSFRSFRGEVIYARIQGVIKTLRKQKRKVFDVLLEANKNQNICLN